MKRHSGEAGGVRATNPNVTKVTTAASTPSVFVSGKKPARRSVPAKIYITVDPKSGRRWKVKHRGPQAKPENVRAAEDRLREDELRLRRTARALAEVLERTGQGLEASPGVARSVQASENRWRTIAEEYGLLDSGEVAALLGGSGKNRNRAHQLAKEGKIIGVKRGRGTLYPGFEFDHGEVRPVIAEVAAIGRRNHWSDPHLLLWLASPNGYLEGGVPAQMMEDTGRILEAARQDMAERW
ncbi:MULTISPECIES: hypothetical protein [Arthrobacter]|uniref:Antitoxin Xre/MbcA/ParS-like toxin-binding domain-containing protein n=1 Tax=Arthrobacter terricola TaxID=2547396 RepID=A0A4V2ZRM5_9MICC|nr:MULTISPECIES: hypothetical protein [Arthrobacter]MBT8163803.1 hypothetical protein [Arthrobacter sp. GN70]TDF86892.1 hypothetical protein E1809_25395 [Arthrobacter terricola]